MKLIGLLTVCALLAACGDDAPRLLEKYKASRANGDIAAAIVHLKGAVQMSPGDPALRLALGELHNEVFDGFSAEKEFQQAQQLGESDAGRLQAGLARAYWMQGRHRTLVDMQIPTAAAVAERRAEVLAYKGHAQTALGLIPQARESLAAGREAAAGASVPIADLLEANIRAAERDAKSALGIVDGVLKSHPRLFEARVLKAEITRTTGTREAAIAAYGELLELHPRHMPALMERATLLTQSGKFDAAEKDVQTLRTVYGDHFAGHFQEGLLRFHKGQFRSALESFQRALKANKSFPRAQLYEAVTQHMLGNAESAERSLLQYITAYPGDLLGRQMFARVLLKGGQSARALEVLAPVLEANAPHPEFWEMAAEAHARSGDFDKAGDWLARVERARPDSAEVQVKQGMLNLQRGRNDLAASDFADAAKLSETLSTGDTMLVLISLAKRDHEQALAAVKAMEQKSPGDPFVLNMKGYVLLDQGKRSEAAAAFEQALKKNPAFLPAAANLVRIDIMDRNFDSARKRYDDVLVADPNHIQAMTLAAALEQGRGRPKEARDLMHRAVKAAPLALEPRKQLVQMLLRERLLEEALAVADEGVKRKPSDWQPLELLANVRLAAGDMAGARAALARIADLYPKSPAAQVARARLELVAGMPNDAEAALRKALILNKEFVPAQTALFQLLMQQKRASEAAALAGMVRADFPKSPIGHLLEGEVALAQRRPKDAVGHYRTALDLAGTPDLAVRLYQVRMAAGQGKEAFEELKNWVGANPRFAEARALLAQAYLDRGDANSAVREFETVWRARSTDPAAINNLAWAQYKAGNMAAALKLAQEAYQLAPRDPHVADTLGWLLQEQGDLPRARELLAEAARALKDRPDVRFHYGVVLAKSGDAARAKLELDAALKSEVPFAERAAAKALRDKL